MKKSQNYVYEIRKIVFLFYRSYHLDEVHTMVVQAIQKGEIIMEYQYEVEQTKEEFMHEDQWADSLIKWLFIFLIIVGIPYTAYVVVQFILSV
ncbi:DUF3930 domain-containing protein [Bacillus toyonensis]|uniref:DUF3930 domain-containing protein n=2 Tax=Bacillus toyonensis TaxID=155322 RepID=A0A2C3VMQ2_9BACI|nr:DUF3930 domain-containing protein [Bacillus sp. FDAARGOS_235]KAB0449106.1 DUF3930 domain-containing protein [Lysinibacillus sp. VIA-II-2016]PEB29672.1 DUF3930 domain-containing protein [Bacillus toyonensis]PEC09330.1 DUF3930 domain-containing protein [Bacillus toyonensis]PED74981.1 DUF3930 domain-containing protein [Bacillus toyonensis]